MAITGPGDPSRIASQAFAMVSRQESSPDASAPGPLNVVAELDGTDPCLEGGICWNLKDLEAARSLCGPQMTATARLRRAGKPTPGSIEDTPWSGARTYQIQPIRTRSIDSTPIESELMSHLSAEVPNVLFMAGHGTGSEVAGMTTSTLASALDQAQARPDAAVFMSCNMANLEGLSALSASVPYAIASETTLPGFELMTYPLTAMMLAGALSGSGGLGLAAAMAAVLDRTSPGQYALLDLDALGTLRQQMITLGKELSVDLAGPSGQSLWQAASDSQRSLRQQSAEEPAELGDLGVFLRSLGRASLRPQTQAELGRARELLDRTVLGYSGGDRGLTGLSFNTLQFMQDVEQEEFRHRDQARRNELGRLLNGVDPEIADAMLDVHLQLERRKDLKVTPEQLSDWARKPGPGGLEEAYPECSRPYLSHLWEMFKP